MATAGHQFNDHRVTFHNAGFSNASAPSIRSKETMANFSLRPRDASLPHRSRKDERAAYKLVLPKEIGLYGRLYGDQVLLKKEQMVCRITDDLSGVQTFKTAGQYQLDDLLVSMLATRL
jgi:hypothetical protein